MQRNTGYFPTESLEPSGNRLFSRSALNEGDLFRGSLGVFSIGEFVGYLIRSLVAPAFVWFPDILIGMPDNLIQAIAAVWLVVMSIFVPTVIERAIDGF